MKQVKQDWQEQINFFQEVIKNQHYCPWYEQFKKANKKLAKTNKQKFINKSIEQFNTISNNVAFIVQLMDNIDTASIEIVLEKTKTDEFIKKLNDWLGKVDNNLNIKTEAHKDKMALKKERETQKKTQIKKAKKDLRDLVLKKRCFFW